MFHFSSISFWTSILNGDLRSKFFGEAYIERKEWLLLKTEKKKKNNRKATANENNICRKEDFLAPGKVGLTGRSYRYKYNASACELEISSRIFFKLRTRI